MCLGATLAGSLVWIVALATWWVLAAPVAGRAGGGIVQVITEAALADVKVAARARVGALRAERWR